ncbi:MAG: right-handed parallel beta-helix repeat-containing protein [Candidatus Paceibacterota bacterium]
MMFSFLTKVIFASVVLFFAFSSSVFAQAEDGCEISGYSILTINGILTNEVSARENKDALKKLLPAKYNNERVVVDFLWNPSHLGGGGDFAKTVEQGLYDNETVVDYDLIEMLKVASEKVQTQKLLIVAHSQGNFYANNFYDVVADQAGGVPKGSLGVYGVATPSGRVAGGGKYLTSTNDLAIAKIVGKILGRNILPPNIEIPVHEGDEFWRHDFSQIYLKYQGARVVSDIREALDRLKNNDTQVADKPCIDSPAFSIKQVAKGVAFGVFDPIFGGTEKVMVATVSGLYQGGLAVAKAGVWTFSTLAQFGDFVASTISSVFAGSADSVALSGNVGLALSAIDKARIDQAIIDSRNRILAERVLVPNASNSDQPVVVALAPEDSEQNSELVDEPESPKLIFIGPTIIPGYGGGIPFKPPPVAVPVEAEVLDDLSSPPPPAPGLTGSQCLASLATDGCLLATTTLQFSWAPVEGAQFYALDQNGVYSTTTETAVQVVAPDFSDYIFGVSAVDTLNQTSATSTQTVSVATIPIAINEIAWMGTGASASDEWLEIKNNTDHTIDLSQWEIQATVGTPHIALSGVIRPREYLVFERTNDDTITDVLAYQVYTGSLGNNGEQLSLSYASTTLDQTPAISSGGWAAGSNVSSTTRATMERFASMESGLNLSNWGTNLGFIRNGSDADSNEINGTPGERNSVNYLINKGQDILTDLSLGDDESIYIVTNQQEVSASSTLSIEPGTIIKFKSLSSLDFFGQLQANGTVDNEITFQAFDGGHAGSLNFKDAIGTSTISNANFENLEGVSVYGNARLDISDTDFTNNESGIEVYDNGVAVLNNLNFASTTREAVSGYDLASISLSSSTISNTLQTDAVGVYGGKFTMSSSTIDGVSGGDAISVYNTDVLVKNSVLKNGESDGVSVYKGTVEIQDSTISGFTNGSGVDIYRPDEPVKISNTEVTGNEVGVMLDSEDSVIIDSESNVHDNGTSEADNIVF